MLSNCKSMEVFQKTELWNKRKGLEFSRDRQAAPSSVNLFFCSLILSDAFLATFSDYWPLLNTVVFKINPFIGQWPDVAVLAAGQPIGVPGSSRCEAAAHVPRCQSGHFWQRFIGGKGYAMDLSKKIDVGFMNDNKYCIFLRFERCEPIWDSSCLMVVDGLRTRHLHYLI